MFVDFFIAHILLVQAYSRT